MSQNNHITRPKEGYIDGIKEFYNQEDLQKILAEAGQKNFSDDDPLFGRAYAVVKELPDAKPGTVLRLGLTKSGKLSNGKWGRHYMYHSKYVGRNSFLHMEIVHAEKNWFQRIN